MNQNPPYKRRIKLIKPRLQWTLIGTFIGLSALAFLLQYLLIGMRLTEIATEMPAGGDYLIGSLADVLLEVLLVSFGLLLPLIAFVGVSVTFRIAGPIYRFEQYMGQLARGEDPGPCRIRKGDYLHDLCDRINEGVTALREGRVAGATDEDDTEPLRRAG
jgi:hypothetical protein